ncbi:RNA binding protein, heterogenous nuclear RNP-K like protein, partial [Coemansia sp. RSA 2524]
MAQSANAIDISASNGAMVANGLGMPKAQFPFPESSCSDPGSPASAASVPVCAVEPPSVSDSQLTLRALVSTKEAGVIIGKGGRNVANLREIANVKAGVSKVVPGVHDRVLSVTGFLGDVAHAYHLVAQTLVDNPLAVATHAGLQQPASPMQTVVRILIAHNLMGTIIGRQGLKIKHIQDASGARLVATKEMLPQSTERVVEIHGNVEGIRIAIEEIGKCLIEDWERGIGTILYNPATRVPTVTSNANPYVNNVRASYDFTHSDADRVGGLGGGPMSVAMAAMNRHRSHTVSVTRASASDFLSSSIPMPPQQLHHHQQQPLSFSAAVNGGATTPPHLVS